MRRRIFTCLTALTLLVAGITACSSNGYKDGDELLIAGGVKTGVYYSYGEQLAAELQQGLGMQSAVQETEGSVDNLARVASGEAILGFAQGDAAADAVNGEGSFEEPLPITAIARVYDEYVHIVVPADSTAQNVADLSGLRVSLGSRDSGVHVIASRVLAAAGVAVDKVEDPALSLSAATHAMQRGDLDAFFWVGGLPTPGIAELAEHLQLRLLPIEAATVEQVNAGHSGVYRVAEFPLGLYGTTEQISTMTVPNYLIARADTSDALIHDITEALFASQQSITQEVPAAELLDRRRAVFTEPVQLHPGAIEYYREARF